MERIKKVWKIQHPKVFQGNLSSRIYFEGWYYKITSADCKSTYAIIPGIALNSKNNTDHAFIQVLNGTSAEYRYIRYPIDEFSYIFKPHKITVGSNVFTEDSLDMNLLCEDNFSIKGKLKFSNIAALPFSKFSPGIMGPLSYLPFMQTYHGIVSMNHDIQGNLSIKNKTVNFTNGKGYTEKDWGSAFPSEWIWMQSNHFYEKERSFVFSVANIPYLGLNFKGFFALLWDKGNFYKFTSYNGSSLKIIKINYENVSLQIKNKKMNIMIDIDAVKSEDSKQNLTAIMRTPVNGEMVNKTAETMSASIKLNIYSVNSKKKRRNYVQIEPFSDIGRFSGLEIMGFHSNDFE